MALPVLDLDETSQWYSHSFGLTELRRNSECNPCILMQRDGVEIGFSINGEDATQDGTAILVSDIHALKLELQAKGVSISNWRVDKLNGIKHQVFFVAAPDGLCYYFHQPLESR